METNFKDMFSLLPDDVVISIVSFLDLKEALRISVLSKRWKHLSMFCRRLIFQFKMNNPVTKTSMDENVERVNKILKSNLSPTLDEFSVHSYLGHTHQQHVNNWIKYALSMGVRKLELAEYFIFPIPNCGRFLIDESNCHGLRFLRDLSLIRVNVSGLVLQYIVCNSPLLERLTLQGVNGLDSLEITGPSIDLKQLNIRFCIYTRSIKLSNINLVKLEVVFSGIVKLCNVPMLREMHVSGYGYQVSHDVFSQNSCSLANLEDLSVTISFFELEKMESREYPEFANLKILNVQVEVSEHQSLVGITSLLRACPFLHKFSFNLIGVVTEELLESNIEARNRPLEHLEVVEFKGYSGHYKDIALLRYILENATSLQKIVIKPSKAGMNTDELTELIPQNVELVIR